MLKKTDQSAIKSYLEDSSNLKGCFAEGVYFPDNEKEIGEALKECASKQVPITVSAGCTGTTGGCIPYGGWLLGTEKLNKIITIDEKKKFAIIQPGVSLRNFQGQLQGRGLFYPPDPTETSAFLGGNVATNASGSRSYRFGSTRDWVRRLKVVLTNGEVLELIRNPKSEIRNKFELPKYKMPNVKSSAGYYSSPNMDLIDLFIGSEGTLGVVSEIEVGLIPKMFDTFDIIAFFPSEEKVIQFVESAKKQKDVLTLEYFDRNSLELLRSDHPNIPQDAGSAIYLETELTGTTGITGSTGSTSLDKWAAILESNGANLETSWLGMNEKQKAELKEFRHSMPEHLNEEFRKHNTVKLATDIAVPDDRFREMLDYYNTRLASRSTHLFFVKFGHIGQSHLHVNLVPRTQEDIPLAKELIMLFVKKAISLGGTCSAEHGIGKIKYPYLHEMFGDSGIAEMIRIKKLFDPACVLGLGNIFPADRLK
ncbi:FAD-binding oxidoreductase [Candidatus Saganbacteria bacterium]|nr:FAD-binding oxidoreductase [Candidatus Saganbacteria bacterium]